VLGWYWVFGWLLISGTSQPAYPLPDYAWFCLCISLCILGSVIMVAADAQKYVTLRLKPGLITDGIFRYVRHPNYLGETMIYGSFALMVWHWLPRPRKSNETKTPGAIATSNRTSGRFPFGAKAAPIFPMVIASKLLAGLLGTRYVISPPARQSATEHQAEEYPDQATHKDTQPGEPGESFSWPCALPSLPKALTSSSRPVRPSPCPTPRTRHLERAGPSQGAPGPRPLPTEPVGLRSFHRLLAEGAVPGVAGSLATVPTNRGAFPEVTVTNGT
jgi:hypothetical protein